MAFNQSSSFRAALKRELPTWLQEGIVTEDSARRLAARYELDKLSKESSGLLAAVIFTLGGLLLGGGLLSFVAANWEAIPTFAKVAFLLVLLLAFHLTGYWLWHHKGWSRLGHALVFTGSLVFGANIGLMAQIFHVSGEWYGAFGAWALGSLAMAYAARSWITGVLSLWLSLIWFHGIFDHHPSVWMAIIPIVLAAAFLTLAWWTSSRVLYVFSFAGLTYALCVLATGRYISSRYILVTIVAGGFLAWVAGEFHRVKNLRPEFGNPTAGLGILILSVNAYLWSFHGWWDVQDWLTENQSRPQFYWLIPTAIAGVVGIALLMTIIRSLNAQSSRRLLVIGITAASVILILCAILSATNRSNQALLTFGVNVAALLLAAVAIAIGIMDERRIAFWAGALFSVLLIITRFLEYETSLLLKSAAFTLCGLAMITAGVAYEKYLSRKELRV